MPGLTTIFNYGQGNIADPLYFEQDYGFDFGILKNWSSVDIVDRIKHFVPSWINCEPGSNTEKLIQSVVGDDSSGLKFLFNQLKILINDCFLGSAVLQGLYQLGLEYTLIYPRVGEHDWHFRYRIFEMIFKMKPTRNNLDRLVIKWLGVGSVTQNGSSADFMHTVQRFTLPETYHYYVYDQYYKDLKVYKNGELLIRDYDYQEVGKKGRRSRIVDFLKPVYNYDDLKFVVLNHSPHKETETTGDNLTPINIYRFVLPVSHKYLVGSVEDINLRVYKNGSMLKRFDDYLEVGEESSSSQVVYIYEQPEVADKYLFEILGHSQSEGYHMFTCDHRILEQKDYGFYGGASYLCMSNDSLEVGDLVNFDPIEKVAEYANGLSTVNIPTMGVVNDVVGSVDQPYYTVKSTGSIINRLRNSDRSFVWNWAVGTTLYLDTVNGGITATPPTPPDLVQIIGEVIDEHEILLDSSLGVGIPEVFTFYNSPTGKFNKPGVIYIIIKNAVDFGAEFYNYNPQTAFYGSNYESLGILGTNSHNLQEHCIKIVSQVPGILPTDTTVTIQNGSTPQLRKVIINENQGNEEVYNDVHMNNTLPSTYLVDVINNASFLVTVERLVPLETDILPNLLGTTPLDLNRDSYYEGDEDPISQPGLAFYGIDHLVHLNGITKNSELDNLMKEVTFSKPVGVHPIYELHPLELQYRENRYVNTV